MVLFFEAGAVKVSSLLRFRCEAGAVKKEDITIADSLIPELD